jgi:uncharacterized RDD family membrane protein YckC
MKPTAKLVASSLVYWLLLVSIAAACPTCGDGIGQSDPQGQSLAAGMYYSILFMMSMPYLILATLGSLAYLSIRRARLAAAASDGVPGVEALPSRQD